jgi:hypothetical protein
MKKFSAALIITDHEKILSCLNNFDNGCHMVYGSYIHLCCHKQSRSSNRRHDLSGMTCDN